MLTPMNDQQLLRYSRHILLDEVGIEGLEWVLAAHALVIGAGGLGSPAALYLGSAGVGRITLVDHDVVVGDFTHVAPHVTLGGSVKLGKNILLGAGCTVLPGLTVTDGVVIGAGAVVCRHIEQAGTYIGVPARRIA